MRLMCLLQRDWPLEKRMPPPPQGNSIGKKIGWQSELEAQDLIGIAGIESDQGRPGFLL
jgi:hypothetical protein